MTYIASESTNESWRTTAPQPARGKLCKQISQALKYMMYHCTAL